MIVLDRFKIDLKLATWNDSIHKIALYEQQLSNVIQEYKREARRLHGAYQCKTKIYGRDIFKNDFMDIAYTFPTPILSFYQTLTMQLRNDLTNMDSHEKFNQAYQFMLDSEKELDTLAKETRLQIENWQKDADEKRDQFEKTIPFCEKTYNRRDDIPVMVYVTLFLMSASLIVLLLFLCMLVIDSNKLHSL